eukprot:477995-Pelagomonas_calceolata.AAC.2
MLEWQGIKTLKSHRVACCVKVCADAGQQLLQQRLVKKAGTPLFTIPAAAWAATPLIPQQYDKEEGPHTARAGCRVICVTK